jgi:hypothetical protein
MVLLVAAGAKAVAGLVAVAAVAGFGVLIGKYHSVSGAHKAVKDEIAAIEGEVKAEANKIGSVASADERAARAAINVERGKIVSRLKALL